MCSWRLRNLKGCGVEVCQRVGWIWITGKTILVPNTYSNKVLSILHLKVFVLSQLDMSGLREFQSLIVQGKKLYLKTSVLTDGGIKW